MIFSISPRWAGEMVCARAGRKSSASTVRTAPAANARRIDVIETVLSDSVTGRLLTGLGADYVVGLQPAGAANGKSPFGTGGDFARGAHIAAIDCGLRRGEIGFGEIALPSVSHGELGIGAGHFRFARQRRAQQLDG